MKEQYKIEIEGLSRSRSFSLAAKFPSILSETLI